MKEHERETLAREEERKPVMNVTEVYVQGHGGLPHTVVQCHIMFDWFRIGGTGREDLNWIQQVTRDLATPDSIDQPAKQLWSHLYRGIPLVVSAGAMQGTGRCRVAPEDGHTLLTTSAMDLASLTVQSPPRWSSSSRERQSLTPGNFRPQPVIAATPLPRATYGTLPHPNFATASQHFRYGVEHMLRVLSCPGRVLFEQHPLRITIKGSDGELRPAVPSTCTDLDCTERHRRADSFKLTNVTVALDMFVTPINSEVLQRLKHKLWRERKRALNGIYKAGPPQQLCVAVTRCGLLEMLGFKLAYGRGSRSSAATDFTKCFPSTTLGPLYVQCKHRQRYVSIHCYVKSDELLTNTSKEGVRRYRSMIAESDVQGMQIVRLDLELGRTAIRDMGIDQVHDAFDLTPETAARTVLANIGVKRMTKQMLKTLLCRRALGKIDASVIEEYSQLMRIALIPIILFAKAAGAPVSLNDLFDSADVVKAAKRPKSYNLDDAWRFIRKCVRDLCEKIADPEVDVRMGATRQARAQKRAHRLATVKAKGAKSQGSSGVERPRAQGSGGGARSREDHTGTDIASSRQS